MIEITVEQNNTLAVNMSMAKGVIYKLRQLKKLLSNLHNGEQFTPYPYAAEILQLVDCNVTLFKSAFTITLPKFVRPFNQFDPASVNRDCKYSLNSEHDYQILMHDIKKELNSAQRYVDQKKDYCKACTVKYSTPYDRFVEVMDSAGFAREKLTYALFTRLMNNVKE